MTAGYRTIPPCDDLMGMEPRALADVRDFTVVRDNYGSIQWLGSTDIRGLSLDELVSIDNNEVCRGVVGCRVWGVVVACQHSAPGHKRAPCT
jgi:hypothetical protein